ncbi:DUF364 domain-containing protein|uniref:Heavy-metal chelation n=1 Tax=Dendrosporobacter quercicolus TaxID=146817 RepID=A0A1G9RJ79_9FIRM|nr:DUF364 domain-containing protein [Dendrosporobacter quercicolus]NSL49430.1 DUF364 domain-containing protein [Dendrosporobacter quercicolus DSM 1736]SDM23362.1 hypothetical protein SAMN04488502_10313 [Dendrosporobacter quercicolus]
MWTMYDHLLDLLPEDVKIRECLVGLAWFLVRSEGVGIAMTPPEGNRNFCFTGKVAGAGVRDVACWLKSWNFFEAAMGLAAINSVLNTPERLQADLGLNLTGQPEKHIFLHMLDQVRGKKVAVIGHFRDLELLAPVCQLSILERRPFGDDFPDPACEYILPHQDYVFITATTLINKTLPRLLELSRQAYVVLVGPSTPLTPLLFDYGIDMLAGTAVIEQEQVWRLIQEGDRKEFFHAGAQMVKFSAAGQ